MLHSLFPAESSEPIRALGDENRGPLFHIGLRSILRGRIKGESDTLSRVPPANNRRGHKIALERGWYCRFDPELRASVSCGKDDEGAMVDLIRGLKYLRTLRDPGPSTMESIAEQRRNAKHAEVGVPGVNC